jgi:magnesium chelatase family protein
MLAKLHTLSLLGIDALPVEVEVDVSAAALPKVLLVGLPEAAVKESIHRVERALVNSAFWLPDDRIVINLAPADLPKQAASFELPMALGLLAASGQLDSDRFSQYAVVGELALDGSTRAVKGALSMAMAAAASGLRGLVIPSQNGAEAAVVSGLKVIPVDSLTQAAGFFGGHLDLEPVPSQVDQLFEELSHYEVDFGDVRGQEMAKRALTLAAAGAHNLLMVGPPGSGKTMLAKRVPTILPQLSAAESIETTRIYSAMGRMPEDRPLLVRRPFRAPHHTTSNAGLVGGGSTPTPGDISMAHHGVLFLDELPEFNRQTLEVLRQPLEDGQVTISRALRSATFPANFMLIASLNPCPCGYRNDPRRDCHCSVPQVERYMAKISGPLLDRIDLHIEVPAVPFQEFSAQAEGTNSRTMRSQVEQARRRQAERFDLGSFGLGSNSDALHGDALHGDGANGSNSVAHANGVTHANAHMSSRQLRKLCKLNGPCRQLMEVSVQELGLSARAHDKVLRVARTIADVEGCEEIREEHLSEAVNYRVLDRQFWS